VRIANAAAGDVGDSSGDGTPKSPGGRNGRSAALEVELDAVSEELARAKVSPKREKRKWRKT